MFISMTGFGRCEEETSFGRVSVEIQSVNRKHLEVAVYLPREFSRLEMDLRKWISELFSRGQVTLRIHLSWNEESLSKTLPNAALLKSLREAWIKIAHASGCEEKSIDLPFLMQFLPAQAGLEWDDAHGALLLEIAGKAAKEAVSMKRKEGASLAKDIAGRLDLLEGLSEQIAQISPDAVAKLRDKLKERMQSVLQMGAELDERLLKEVAFFAEKIDISEEITRFYSHLEQFRSAIRSEESRSIGRKLEFIVQEMGREINTIGSKSADASISRLVVDAKSELEKIREQIQNIE